MFCPKCGAENPEIAFFCGSCGHQLKSALEQPQGQSTLGRPANEISQPLDTNAPGAGLYPPPQPPIAPPPYTPPVEPPQYAPPAEAAEVPPEQQPDQPPAQEYAPPQTQYAPPPVQGAIQPPLGNPPGQPGYQPEAQHPYQPPQAGYQQPQQYAPPPGAAYGQGQAPYGAPTFSQPPDGNTSGMGPGYAEPFEAQGWTFAGFVPFGIYAFVMGNVMWGVIGLVCTFLGIFNLIYVIYIGINGKKLAWQGKRFDGIQQFWEVQRGWNTAGLVCLALGLVIGLIQSCVFVAALLSEGT